MRLSAQMPVWCEVAARVGEKPLADLDGAMAAAFAMKDRLVFLDIFIDPMEHVYPMHIAPHGSMKDMWLSKNERT